MSDSAFRLDSDEGRDVLLTIVPSRLESEEAIEVVGVRAHLRDDRPKLTFRLSNDEAAELLSKLDDQIGSWARERAGAYAEWAAGRASFEDDQPVELDDLSDPDHPRHAEALAAAADWQRKDRKENR